jgi:hypothetical protein
VPLSGDVITWARPRVQNFSDEYARRFVKALVSLDGAEFDKAAFFGALVEQSVVGEPTIPAGKTREEIYAKRWDSYLAPIRPFGLGFTVAEKRQQSPNNAKLIWRVSSMARELDDNGLDHRAFMAIQLARTQFPKITMPLKDPAKTELDDGAAIQPLRLFIEVTDRLVELNNAAHLTRQEIWQLPRCHTHNDVSLVVDEIVAHRGGATSPDWVTTEPADLDILINDMNATGYFRRLPAATGDQPWLVPSYASINQARALVARIGWVDVTTNVGIEEYYARLGSSPSDDDRTVLDQASQVIGAATDEISLVGDELTGPAHLVGGLHLGDRVYINSLGRLLEVTEHSEGASSQPDGWVCTAKSKVVAYKP